MPSTDPQRISTPPLSELDRLRAAVAYCRMRLKQDAHRETLDAILRGDKDETLRNPDRTPIVLAGGNDEPHPGDWIDCWGCGGEGGHEGDDPFWDLGEWYRCDVCRGKGGWTCEATEAPANG